VREEGLLETLIYQVMPYECEENNDGLWLTAVLISRIAKNQIFSEGNKRTSYLVGVLFLRHLQDVNGFEGALIPELSKELTRLLSDIAVQNKDADQGGLHDERNLERDVEDLYNYLKEGMEEFINEQIE
jgi:prophage maintenance system killer protein